MCKNRRALLHALRFLHNRDYKPGSVLTAIYLDAPLPVRSSHLPGSGRADHCLLHGVAPNRVYSAAMFPCGGGALTSPFHPYPVGIPDGAVYFCCTFPEVAFGGRYPLFLPCGARTFLMKAPFGKSTRLSVPVAEILYFIFSPLSNRLQNFFFRGIIKRKTRKRGRFSWNLLHISSV